MHLLLDGAFENNPALKKAVMPPFKTLDN